MSLTVNHIAFADFRSYASFDLAGIGPLTVLVGPNAVGKTNVIEGIQLVTSQSSFRNPTGAQLVREGAAAARLQADVSDAHRTLQLVARIEEGKRKWELNGKPKRPADLKGLVPSVVFTPDDLELAKGSQSVRRAALDALASQLSRAFYTVRHDYEKVVRHKNSLLKDEAAPLMIESVNDLMVTCGAQLVCYRARLFAKMSPVMGALYHDISGGREAFAARYAPSWLPTGAWLPEDATLTREEARACMERALAGRREEERARHRSLVGPHADRVEFFVDGRPIGTFGSQGQQRSVALAFKLAEVALIQDMLDQQPLLLLDDVMSELDERRRRALVTFISGDIQTFITTANLAYFDPDLLSDARVVRLPLDAGGRVQAAAGS